MAGDDTGGREFTARALACLPEAPLPPGLAASLLAAYDARSRPWLQRAANLIWPGVPAWALGAVLAASLLLGIGLGVMAPTLRVQADGLGFSLDDPPSLSLDTVLSVEGP